MSEILGISEFRGVVTVEIEGDAPLRVRKKNAAALTVGMEIDRCALVDEIAGAQLPEAYETALAMLDLSDRTSAKIRESLLRKGFVEPAVDAVIDRLTAGRYLDDARFAERAAERMLARGEGVYRLRQKLRSQGVPKDEIDRAAGGVSMDDQREAALDAAKKLSRRYRDEEPRKARQKLQMALARRGYPPEAVSYAVAHLKTEENSSKP